MVSSGAHSQKNWEGISLNCPKRPCSSSVSFPFPNSFEQWWTRTPFCRQFESHRRSCRRSEPTKWIRTSATWRVESKTTIKIMQQTIKCERVTTVDSTKTNLLKDLRTDWKPKWNWALFSNRQLRAEGDDDHREQDERYNEFKTSFRIQKPIESLWEKIVQSHDELLSFARDWMSLRDAKLSKFCEYFLPQTFVDSRSIDSWRPMTLNHLAMALAIEFD